MALGRDAQLGCAGGRGIGERENGRVRLRGRRPTTIDTGQPGAKIDHQHPDRGGRDCRTHSSRGGFGGIVQRRRSQLGHPYDRRRSGDGHRDDSCKPTSESSSSCALSGRRPCGRYRRRRVRLRMRRSEHQIGLEGCSAPTNAERDRRVRTTRPMRRRAVPCQCQRSGLRMAVRGHRSTRPRSPRYGLTPEPTIGAPLRQHPGTATGCPQRAVLGRRISLKPRSPLRRVVRAEVVRLRRGCYR